MADNQQCQLVIGLTGGIASGKTLAADTFGNCGATIIDTDIIAREVVAVGQPGLTAVTDAFGEQVLRPDGTLDRQLLRDRVFADPAARQQLEALLHPLIRAATKAQLASATGPYIVIVVPLLAETGFQQLVQRVVVIDCPVESQLQRLQARDGETATSAAAIVAAQASREKRLELADDVIVNDGSKAQLVAQVQKLHLRYLELATAAKLDGDTA